MVSNKLYDFDHLHYQISVSLVAQSIKNPFAMQETQVPSLAQEDPLEKEMATYSSILAWKFMDRESIDRRACRARPWGLKNWQLNHQHYQITHE